MAVRVKSWSSKLVPPEGHRLGGRLAEMWRVSVWRVSVRASGRLVSSILFRRGFSKSLFFADCAEIEGALVVM